jgi:hypothetical protein
MRPRTASALIPNTSAASATLVQRDVKLCMLAFLKVVADFSRGCMLSMISAANLLTDPHSAIRGSLHASSV